MFGIAKKERMCYHARAFAEMSRDSSKHSRWAVFLAYFMIYVVWGSTYFFIGEALNELPPYLLGALRFTTAGLIISAAAAWRGENLWSRPLIRASAICGMLLLFTDMAIIMLAQQYISSSLEAILAASTLIWITLMDVPMWKRNFCSPGVVFGVLGGMAGVMMLYWGELTAPVGKNGDFGVLFFMIACFAWSLGSLISKYKASAYEDTNAWSGTAWQMLTAGGAFWICSFWQGEPYHMNWCSITWHGWGALAYLIIFGSILAYSSYVWLLKIRPATEVGTHAYANPFVAIVLGSCIGDEVISTSQWAGLSIILLSLFLVDRFCPLNNE